MRQRRSGSARTPDVSVCKVSSHSVSISTTSLGPPASDIMVSYCSRECQCDDWNRHKKVTNLWYSPTWIFELTLHRYAGKSRGLDSYPSRWMATMGFGSALTDRDLCMPTEYRVICFESSRPYASSIMCSNFSHNANRLASTLVHSARNAGSNLLVNKPPPLLFSRTYGNTAS